MPDKVAGYKIGVMVVPVFFQLALAIATCQLERSLGRKGLQMSGWLALFAGLIWVLGTMSSETGEVTFLGRTVGAFFSVSLLSVCSTSLRLALKSPPSVFLWRGAEGLLAIPVLFLNIYVSLLFGWIKV